MPLLSWLVCIVGTPIMTVATVGRRLFFLLLLFHRLHLTSQDWKYASSPLVGALTNPTPAHECTHSPPSSIPSSLTTTTPPSLARLEHWIRIRRKRDSMLLLCQLSGRQLQHRVVPMLETDTSWCVHKQLARRNSVFIGKYDGIGIGE